MVNVSKDQKNNETSSAHQCVLNDFYNGLPEPQSEYIEGFRWNYDHRDAWWRFDRLDEDGNYPEVF